MLHFSTTIAPCPNLASLYTQSFKDLRGVLSSGMATEFDIVRGEVLGNAKSHSSRLDGMIRQGREGWLLR